MHIKTIIFVGIFFIFLGLLANPLTVNYLFQYATEYFNRDVESPTTIQIISVEIVLGLFGLFFIFKNLEVGLFFQDLEQLLSGRRISFRKQNIILVVLIILINFIYFISSAYIASSNDGSHFALVSALVEERSVKINNFLKYTLRVDYAYKDGEYYSDRIPGTAFLSIPFYIFGKLLQQIGFSNYLSSHPNIKEIFVVFLPNIAGTVILLVMFKLFRFFKFDFRTSLLSSLIFALSTLIWLESARLFSHAISAMIVLLAVYLALRINNFQDRKKIILIFLFLALASIVEIQNIVFVPIFFIYFLISKKLKITDVLQKEVAITIVLAAVTFIVIYSALIIYNFVAFGEIIINSSQYNSYTPCSKAGLSGNILYGLDRLFTNFSNSEVIYNWFAATKNFTPGLFVVSPILVVSLIGFYYFFKAHRNETLFFLLLIASQVAIVASYKCLVLTRYATTISPYLFLPAAYIIDKLLKSLKKKQLSKYFLFYLVLGLVLISIARVYFILSTSWGRRLLMPFRFIIELPCYFLFYGVLFLICAFLKRAGIIKKSFLQNLFK